MDQTQGADTLSELGEMVAERLGDAVVGWQVAHGELSVTVACERIVAVARKLRDDPQLRFECLIDVAGVDYPGRERRFEVVYHFLSPRQNQRLRVKLTASEETAVPSLVGVYPVANWFEREAFDLYGILFSGHPDLRRILTDYGFRGHPLRKDFPTTGYTEVRYDEAAKRVVYEPVSLVQEYRQFDFMSPWEGADYILPGDDRSAPDGHVSKDAK